MNIRRPAAIAASTAVISVTAVLAATPAGATTQTDAPQARQAPAASQADGQLERVQPAGDVTASGDWEYVNWYWFLATCLEHGERGDGPAWKDYFCMPIGVPGQPTTYYELWVEYY